MKRRLALLLASFALAPAWALDLPSHMVLVGTIASSYEIPPTAPRAGDRVLALEAASGALAGYGIVIDSSGTFVMELSKTTAYRGTLLALQLQRGSSRRLLTESGRAAEFEFAGQLLPWQKQMALRIGDELGTPAAGLAGRAMLANAGLQKFCEQPEADLNHDGHCDELDMEIAAQYPGGMATVVGQP